jgi:hypothetical protein
MAGWLFLTQPGKTGEAQVKLSAVAEQDSMAALGLVRAIGMSDPAKAKAEAAKLLNAYPSGVRGAVLVDSVKDLGVKVSAGAGAAALEAAVGKMPRDWMRIIDVPRSFYLVRGEPLRTSVPFGEPLLARLTIQNICDSDLTIGKNGVLDPLLYFDVQLSGLATVPLSNVCVDRITDQFVLKPRQTITRIVRLDQHGLAEGLKASPSTPLILLGKVRTNALLRAGGAPGPCGYAADFSRMMERAQFKEDFERAVAAAGSADARERIRNIEALAIFRIMLAKQEKEEVKAVAASMLEAVRKARTDPDASVRAWAGVMFVLAAPPEQRAEAVAAMLADEAWKPRLLGLFALRILPADQQKAMAQKALEQEKDELVKDFASAALELAQHPPTTKPTAETKAPGATEPGAEQKPQ